MRVLLPCAVVMMAGFAPPAAAQQAAAGASAQGGGKRLQAPFAEPRAPRVRDHRVIPLAPGDELLGDMWLETTDEPARGQSGGFRLSIKPGRGLKAIARLRF